ncbi:MAG: Stk1 family PASTA domain-containing Ser/Thr kinase [Acidimicrobiia bacterium]
MSVPAKVFSNRYEIVREIARGGMADVYLARDQMLDRPVALKVLFPEFARDPAFVERFRREAQSAAGLNHPNIVGIYDWGVDDGTYFIVMEYVEGRTLRDLLREDGPMPATEAAAIGASIAAALAFAHKNGVVHRDVKPGNVLITANGEVKVTDFGIARAGTSEALTQTGNVMGTATYFSPEQAQGFPVDARSDVYSLGVVLYELVAGVPPFQGDSPVAVAYKHVRETPIPLSERVPGVPADYERIVERAMAKDVADRYQSATDLREDLLRFDRGRPLAAAPVTAMVAEVPAATTTSTPRIEPVAAPAPPKKSNRGAIVAITVLVIALAALGGFFLWKALTNGSDAKTVSVPNVVGLSQADATKQLRDAGFEVSVSEQPNVTVPAGKVVSQKPGANERLEQGQTVQLVISTGAAQVSIPSDGVVGATYDDAAKTLQGLGLVPAPKDEASSTVKKGQVIRTDPAAGTKVATGATVTVFVSTGEAPVQVPDVTNLPSTDAANRLGVAGFSVQTVNEPSDTVGAGRVIRTDPAANSEQPKGTTVRMFVSTGPAQITLPNVVGSTTAQAQATLTQLGLQVQVVTVASQPANNGKVLAQSPTAGSRAKRGDTVTITVGQTPVSSSSTSTTT